MKQNFKKDASPNMAQGMQRNMKEIRENAAKRGTKYGGDAAKYEPTHGERWEICCFT